MRKHKLTPWLLLTPFLAVTALVVVSVWNILVQSLGLIPAFGLTEPTLEYYRQVLTSESFLSSLLVSLKIAFASAAMATVLGVVGGGRVKTIALVLVPYIQSGDRALASAYSVAFVGSAMIVFFIFEALINKYQKEGTT